MAAGDPILAADYAGIRLATIDRPMVRLTQSAAQAIVAGGTAITFLTEDWDPYGYHNTAANQSRITPTRAGYHTIKGGVAFAATATVCAVWLRKNGATAIASGQREPITGGATARLLLCQADIYFNGTTDYVEMMGDPAASINTNNSLQFSCFLEAGFTGRVTNP